MHCIAHMDAHEVLQRAKLLHNVTDDIRMQNDVLDLLQQHDGRLEVPHCSHSGRVAVSHVSSPKLLAHARERLAGSSRGEDPRRATDAIRERFIHRGGMCVCL